VIEAQQPAKAFAAVDRSVAVSGGGRFEQAVVEGLVRALGVVVRRILAQHVAQMACAEGDHLVEALAADRADEALGERLQIRYPLHGAV
jgi:hypothetical protein